MGQVNNWEGKYKKGEHGTQRVKPSRTVPRFIERLGLSEHSRILDVGCGNGVNTAEIARTGYDVVGVDISHIALKEAREIGLSVAKGDMHRLPLRSGSFDAVYSCNTLDNRELSMQEALSEIHRVLKNGGIAYLCFFENIVCRIPDPDSMPYLERRDLNAIIKSYFDVINETETLPGDSEYDVWTDFPGVDAIGKKGEHTHYRPCFFLRKS